jgi:hypothetical protein
MSDEVDRWLDLARRARDEAREDEPIELIGERGDRLWPTRSELRGFQRGKFR